MLTSYNTMVLIIVNNLMQFTSEFKVQVEEKGH